MDLRFGYVPDDSTATRTAVHRLAIGTTANNGHELGATIDDRRLEVAAQNANDFAGGVLAATRDQKHETRARRLGLACKRKRRPRKRERFQIDSTLTWVLSSSHLDFNAAVQRLRDAVRGCHCG